MTATEGLLVPQGHGRVVRTPAQRVTFKATGTHSRTASTFEVEVPPRFDMGTHVHTRSEELFHVLEGEPDLLAFEPRVRTPDNWQRRRSSSGSRVVRATPGTVPVGRYRIGIPDNVRAITSRWISLVPSKIV